MSTDAPLATAAAADDLSEAVEENLYALFRAMATLPESTLVEGEALSYHLAFPSNPMFKGVWRTRLAADDADAAIAETLAWFEGQRAPFFFWWTGPRTTPDDLGHRLAQRGLRPMDAQLEDVAAGMRFSALGSPGMVADLRHMNEAALAQVPASFRIEEVRDERALDAFKRVAMAGYGIPEAMAQGWVQAALAYGLGHSPLRMYVGYLRDEPVATHLLFSGAGVAGVYAVATVPEARGRGIGGAITLQPLLEERARGYHHAVLFSTEIGIRAYERIGFRDCGVRINRYLWRHG